MTECIKELFYSYISIILWVLLPIHIELTQREEIYPKEVFKLKQMYGTFQPFIKDEEIREFIEEVNFRLTNFLQELSELDFLISKVTLSIAYTQKIEPINRIWNSNNRG